MVSWQTFIWQTFLYNKDIFPISRKYKQIYCIYKMGDRNQKYRDIKKVFIVRSEEDQSVYLVPIYVVLQLRESTIPNFIYRNNNWGVIKTELHLHSLLLTLLQDHKRQIYQKYKGTIVFFIWAMLSWTFIAKKQKRDFLNPTPRLQMYPSLSLQIQDPLKKNKHCHIGKVSGKSYDSNTPRKQHLIMADGDSRYI